MAQSPLLDSELRVRQHSESEAVVEFPIRCWLLASAGGSSTESNRGFSHSTEEQRQYGALRGTLSCHPCGGLEQPGLARDRDFFAGFSDDWWMCGVSCYESYTIQCPGGRVFPEGGVCASRPSWEALGHVGVT
eukprot:2565322-Rhodomonas_salina.5